MSGIYSAVLHAGSGYWMLGRIEDHRARPLNREEIDAAATKLNTESAARLAELLAAAIDGKPWIIGDLALEAQLARVSDLRVTEIFLRDGLSREQHRGDQLQTRVEQLGKTMARNREEAARLVEQLADARQALANHVGGD
jgi:hypothetical protein